MVWTGPKSEDRPVPFVAKQTLTPGETSSTGVLALLAEIAQDTVYYRPEGWSGNRSHVCLLSSTVFTPRKGKYFTWVPFHEMIA